MAGENISAIQTALATYGISAENPCDLSALGDQVTEKTEKLIKEVKETLSEIAGKATGPLFWPTLTTILAEVLGVGIGVATAYADKMIGDFIARSAGTMYATLALAMTSVNGFQLIINYLAAIAVRNAALKRIEMGRIIEVDLRIMISFIRQLQRALDTATGTEANFTSLVLAWRELERAAVILGVELSKLENRESYGVSKTQTGRAIDHIEESLDLISGGGFGAASEALDAAARESYPDIAAELGMSLSDVSDNATYTANYTTFAAALNKSINKEVWQSLSRTVLTASSYETAVSTQITVLDTYLSQSLPLLPQFARLILIQELVGSSVRRLTTRIPLAAGLLDKGTKWLTDRLTPNLGANAAWLPPQSNFMDEPALLKQDSRLTWKRTITAVQATETALLLAPTYFDFLKEVAGIAAAILQPTLSTIQEVKADMKDAVANIHAGTLGIGGTVGRKVIWSTKLITAKALLAGLTPTTARGDANTAGIDIAELQNLELRAEKSLEQLKNLIKSQNLNDDGTSRTLPGEEAYDVAQKYLLPLVASQAILLHKATAARILSGLIAVRVLIKKQQSEDRILVEYCDRFISNVETLPNFEMLKDRYDSLLKAIGIDSSLGKIASDLMNGNLSSLADVLDGIAKINEMTNLALCIAGAGVPELNAPELQLDSLEASWPDTNMNFKKWESDKNRSITDLKDKKIGLEEFISLVSQFANA